MLGLMMDRALSLPSILEYAAAYHGGREVVSRSV
jgi:fatty-acyl-CoA synthase